MTLFVEFVVTALIAGQLVYAERPMANAAACHATKITVEQQLKSNGAKIIVALCRQRQEPML